MPNDFHERAEALAAEAELLSKHGDRRAARERYAAAADVELQALSAAPAEKKRTRTILAVSLVALLYKARSLAEAETHVHRFLGSSDLLPFGRAQLKELLEVIFDEQALPSGYEYSAEEVLITLRGSDIGSGTAPFDLVLQKGNDIKSYTIRAMEYRGAFPFRHRGMPPTAVIEALKTRFTQATASSYRFAIKFVEPAQLDFLQPVRIKAGDVSDTIFDFLRLATGGTRASHQQLRALVPDDDYRRAMLKLARNIIPTEPGLSEVEVARPGKPSADGIAEPQRFAIRREAKFALNTVIDFEIPPPKARAIVRIGVLRAVHLDKQWLEIQSADGNPLHYLTPPDVLDDVVGPMVNRRVRIRGHVVSRRGKEKLYLDDIELETAYLCDAQLGTSVPDEQPGTWVTP